jgi:PIN domain nuclease of toxin-antitoxin system
VILLDTHVLVHYAAGDKRIGKRTRLAIDRAIERDELFMSALSFWEIAMLVARGRLALDSSVAGFRVATLRQGVQ